MARRIFIHYFDVVIRKEIQSGSSNFEQAYADWTEGFYTQEQIKAELLDTNDDALTLAENFTNIVSDELDLD